MKVLFASYSAITVLGGGVEVQVRSLARVLKKLGVEVVLFDPWKRYDLTQFKIFHLFGANVGTYHLGRAIKSLGMKLVLTPVFYSRHNPGKLRTATMIATKLRKFSGCWTEHLLCKELCRMADMVLVNTDDELTLITNVFDIPKEKIDKVPNGVDQRFCNATPDQFIERYRLKDFVLYVGHIGMGRKNLLPLLQVLNKNQLQGVLIGPAINSEYGYKCLEIIKNAPNLLMITGLAQDSPLLESAYAACDTFILPSLYETPGLSALEAGLAGAKVCITRYGGTREYFGDYANYLEPASVASIEKALKETLKRPKTDNLKKHIMTNYLWENCGKILLQKYTLLQ
ncbi:MAG: glycosyltransferase family 4 protein [bacterium]